MVLKLNELILNVVEKLYMACTFYHIYAVSHWYDTMIVKLNI